jgi:hypothetical protein
VDIREVYIAEPDMGGTDMLVFTLRVRPGAAPPNSQWYIIWNRTTPDSSADRNYVAMKTDVTGAVHFEYGRISPPSVNLPTRLGEPDNGSFDPATGTIVITIANSKVDNVRAGELLNAVHARTFFARPDGAPVTQASSSDFSPDGTYALIGNAACRGFVTPTGTQPSTPTAASTATPTPDTRLVLHFHGNRGEHGSGEPAETACTGYGAVDVIVCGGPFLVESANLSPNPAALWQVVEPLLNGTADQNIHDPNWAWYLENQTTLSGPMTVEFWASCGGCSELISDWTIRLWADGVKVFEQRVSGTPLLPNVPEKLSFTVTLPQVTASNRFVLHIDPVLHANSIIYYDSTQACPATRGSGPCDSLVRMPLSGPTPTPPPTATPTSTPSGTPEPTPTPMATPTPAPSTPGKVSGGGRIDPSDVPGKAAFGFDVEFVSGGAAPTGELNYVDRESGLELAATSLDSLVISGTHVKFTGTATVNGVPGKRFEVQVDDLGEPGSSDTFSIRIVEPGGYAAGGVLVGGNIQIHEQ